VKHQWGKDDICKRCKLRRSGYQGGRTGSLVYVSAKGNVRSFAGQCAPPEVSR
jgi:hypothetical protein